MITSKKSREFGSFSTEMSGWFNLREMSQDASSQILFLEMVLSVSDCDLSSGYFKVILHLYLCHKILCIAKKFK